MNKDRWAQTIRAAYSDPHLCNVLAEFLSSNEVELKTRKVDEGGRRHYEVDFDRPHIDSITRSKKTA